CSGVFWFVEAASKGNTTAMNNLAFMFESGQVVAKDAEIANYWRNRAAELNQQQNAPQQNAPQQQSAPQQAPAQQNSPAPANPAQPAIGELPENLDGYFGEIIGMRAVKEQLEKIYSFVKLNIKRNNILKERGAEVPANTKGYNFILTGNPGTGKTTVARIISKILYDLGIRQTPEITEVDRSGLVSQYIGETELKTREILQKVRGGTLFIDEAYTLYRENDEKDCGKQVIDVLMKDMEDNRDSYTVIIAGYKNEIMNMVRNANPGFQSRFNYIIEIPDYTDEELIEIAHMFVKKQNYLLGEGVDEAIRKWINHNRIDDKFGNARAMREMVDKAMENQAERIIAMTNASEDDLFTLTAQDFWSGSEDEQTMADYLEELNSMIGLQSVKEEVSALVNRIMVNKERESRGLQASGDFGTLHMAFKGNAGTGKTTIARLIAKLYASMGVLKRSDVFVECSRATLVGQYQGHTAANVKKVVQQALGGILFVDEAYSLVQGEGDSFGKEAVDTLVAEMENNRDRLLVIFAGYGDDIDRFFLNNQGLKSRVPVELVFEDYTNDELFSVMNFMLKQRGLMLSAAAAESARRLIAEKSRERDFGNARGVRNLVDGMIKRQNSRISQMLSSGIKVPDEAFGIIEAEDIGF
ncbi:MAG: AAA family ATPase, partial [Oscillospiraceae bacterium]